MKKPLHPELGMATRKLRADARIDRWPLDQRNQILQWLADGDGLREVAIKIEEHFNKRVHFSTVGKFYARERKRDLAMDYAEAVDFYRTMTDEASRQPINFQEAIQLALGVEFMRAYSANRLTPNDLLRYCQNALRLRQHDLRVTRLNLEEKRLQPMRVGPFGYPSVLTTPPKTPGAEGGCQRP